MVWDFWKRYKAPESIDEKSPVDQQTETLISVSQKTVVEKQDD